MLNQSLKNIGYGLLWMAGVILFIGGYSEHYTASSGWQFDMLWTLVVFIDDGMILQLIPVAVGAFFGFMYLSKGTWLWTLMLNQRVKYSTFVLANATTSAGLLAVTLAMYFEAHYLTIGLFNFALISGALLCKSFYHANIEVKYVALNLIAYAAMACAIYYLVPMTYPSAASYYFLHVAFGMFAVLGYEIVKT